MLTEEVSTTIERLQREIQDLPKKKAQLEKRIEALQHKLRLENYNKYINEWIKHFPDLPPHPFNGPWEDNVATMKEIGLSGEVVYPDANNTSKEFKELGLIE